MTDATTPNENSSDDGRNPVREAIFEAIKAAEKGRSVSPEDVARRVSEKNWNRVIPHVKAEAIRLAKAGEIAIYRKGKPVDPEEFKGVWRLGKPAGSDQKGC